MHGLDYSERRKLLQEAKLQPKIKVMVYESNPRKSLSDSLNSTQKQDERVNKVIYEVRNSRNVTYEKSKRKEDLTKKLKKIRKRLHISKLQEKK